MSATSDLAAKLYDSGYQFWGAGAPDELATYIVEALRTWNALTSFWRTDMTFPLVAGTTWYDLPSQVGSLRPYTVSDNDLLTTIEYHLLEPLTPTYPLAWTGSLQFDVATILGALQGRRDETLSTTGCTISRRLLPAAMVRRIPLWDDMIDLRRVAWLPIAGFGYVLAPLTPSDPWDKESFDFGWLTAASEPPTSFLRSAEPPLAFDVDRVPPIGGDYEILSVNAGPALVTTSATLLGVPDDWSWVVKWGALGDLLSRESNSKDDLRAAYCDKRYQEGLALLTDAPAVLALRLNNVPLAVDAVRNGDDFNVGWQAAPAGTPANVYAAGLNLLGFGPKPDAGPWSITATVVENAPLPALPTDPIQLARDDYDAVLDYAQHLAAFKMGGQEFAATIPLYQAFVKRASLYNAKLAELGFFQRPMYEVSQLEAQRNPVYEGAGPRRPE